MALTIEQVKAALKRERYNFSSWATLNGYSPNTVDRTLRRCLASGKKPRGRVAVKIVEGIEKTIGEKLFDEKKEEQTTNT